MSLSLSKWTCGPLIIQLFYYFNPRLMAGYILFLFIAVLTWSCQRLNVCKMLTDSLCCIDCSSIVWKSSKDCNVKTRESIGEKFATDTIPIYGIGMLWYFIVLSIFSPSFFDNGEYNRIKNMGNNMATNSIAARDYRKRLLK